MRHPMTWRGLRPGPCLLAAALIAARAPASRAETGGPTAALAWFTDAEIEGASPGAEPASALPADRGTVGRGVRLDRAAAVEAPLLRRESGLVSFWIRPEWDGDDGKRHALLRIGDPERNGLLVEKSARNMLRYVMASPEKVTASRSDVSHWDRRVWIGDETSGAVMDELIMRAGLSTRRIGGLSRIVCRDYYRTAPFERISIDHAPNHARSDYRVVVGHSKQFGLRARIRAEVIRLTDFTIRPGWWGTRDAKPFIKWETSDEQVATVDENGLVKGVATGWCTLTATFRGKKATYDLDVIPAERPDLSVLWLSRLPRLRRDAAKGVPAPGDQVRTVAHVGNYGLKETPPGAEVLFELIPDANRNFRLDEGEEAVEVKRSVIRGQLKPYERTEVTFDWRWPDEPSWVRVTLDPGDRIEEVCEANNDRSHLTVARPARIRLDVREGRKLRGTMNLVGSFCPLDYVQAQFELLEGLLRDAVHPTTSPVGVQDSHYIDGVYEFEREGDAVSKAFEEDGRFFQAYHARPRDPGALHEAGHYVLKLPDLHGFDAGDVMLTDESGRLHAGTGLLPRSELLGPAPAGPYYGSLMHGHHLWLHPANAGRIHYYRGYRLEDRSRGGPWPLLPTRRSVLDIRDVEDGPLANAAVYVYDVTHDISLHVGPWIADRSKFAWMTDEDGQYIFPDVTRPTWDDPRTDEAEGRMRVRHPFEQARRMRDMTVEKGTLLLKIVGARHTEFHWLTDTDLQEAFFAGTGPEGRVTVKTSLRSPARQPRVYAERIPDALLKRNLQPVASVDGPVSVKLGGTFTLDASASRDPEGQPIEYYRWTFPSGARVHEGAVISDADVLDLGGSFTLSLWVRADSDGEIFTKASPEGLWVRGGKRLFVRGGEVCFEAYGVGYLASGRRVTGSGWRHVAVVHEKVARALRLYVDGVQVAERKFGMTVDVPGHCVVMGRGFRGAADELRVYGCALSRTEVERLASGRAPKAGLVGHWSFDER
ncbi:MAG: LamG-like jellyroll fold domain-containing protein, partial [Planctomycetota bacterium]